MPRVVLEVQRQAEARHVLLVLGLVRLCRRVQGDECSSLHLARLKFMKVSVSYVALRREGGGNRGCTYSL